MTYLMNDSLTLPLIAIRKFAGDIKGILVDEMPIPYRDYTLLMNAPRPLVGHETLEGGLFLTGRFYALIDLRDEMAAEYIKTNKALDAAVVLPCPIDFQLAIVLNGCRYFDAYMDMKYEDRLMELKPQIDKLYGRPTRELVNRMLETGLGIQMASDGDVLEHFESELSLENIA